MPLLMEAEAESDLLLIEGLEIDPLPDALLTTESLGTSSDPACCSCDQCSGGYEPPAPRPPPCWFFTLG